MSRTTALRRETKPRVGCCDEIVARTVTVIEERVHEPADWTHLQFCNAPVVEGATKCRRHTEYPNRGLLYRWRYFARRGRRS